MKIAFISTLIDTKWGGSELLWYRTAKIALDKGHQVLVSVYWWGKQLPEIDTLKKMGCQIHYRQPYPTSGNLTKKTITKLKNKILHPAFEFKPIIDFNPACLVIGQGGTFDVAYPRCLGLQATLDKINKTYYLISQNNADYGFVPEDSIRIKAKEIFKKAKCFIFVSNRNFEVAQRQLCANIENAKVMINPVNLNITGILPWPDDTKIRFAEVASLKCSHKGQDVLFDILRRDIWKVRNWELNLYGRGENETYLKELAEFYGLSNRINFCGHVSNIREVWNQNHILILPSLGEGTPIALVEAMLCGRPAITTNVGGNTEMITENETGFIAECASIKSFNNAMDRAWYLKDKWKEMGSKAFRIVEHLYTVSAEESLLTLITKP